MRRIHFFEILDQAWCPKAVREGATDALEAITSSTDIYRSVREPNDGRDPDFGGGRGSSISAPVAAGPG